MRRARDPAGHQDIQQAHTLSVLRASARRYWVGIGGGRAVKWGAGQQEAGGWGQQAGSQLHPETEQSEGCRPVKRGWTCIC